jgi:nitrogen fixation-related uncharacterized protein
MSILMMIAGVAVLALLLAVLGYIWSRYYEGRYDRTYMTQDERGFRRGLKGKTVLWDIEESIVKGPDAPRIEFVALDPATGGRRTVQLLDPKTGSLSLRPQYCAPLPFEAVTADSHKVIIEARVQFSINRDLLKHVYEIQEFSLALETRIQSAYRSEVGKRKDEQLRAQIHDVERGVIEQLRTAEAEGDEKGEPGMALGVNFHTAAFTFTQPDEFANPLDAMSANVAATPEAAAAFERVRAIARSQGVLAMRPQQLDQLGDVFASRDAASTAALLAILELQTRQNIAEALASSGQLVVLTAQEVGLFGAAAQRDALMARRAAETSAPPLANGGARPEARP